MLKHKYSVHRATIAKIVVVIIIIIIGTIAPELAIHALLAPIYQHIAVALPLVAVAL